MDKFYLNTDGGSRGNPGNAACAFVIFKNNEIIHTQGKFLGTQTNNYAEYHGLIEGLKYCINNKIQVISIRMDSELIVKQIKGIYKVANINIKPLYAEVKSLLNQLQNFDITHVYRSENSDADKLVNITLDNTAS